MSPSFLSTTMAAAWRRFQHPSLERTGLISAILVLATNPALASADDGHGSAHGDSTLVDRLSHLVSDTTFQGMVFNFGCLALILYFGARGPLSSFLKQRRASVSDQLAEAKRLRDDAEKLHREYEERLGALDAELEKVRGELIHSGETERERIVQEAETKAALMRKEAEFLISQQLKQLEARLTRETVEAAIAAAESVMREQMTAQDHERLADDFAAKLGESIRQRQETRA